MIYRTKYKDRPAVAVENEVLRALFLPEDGAKLVSLYSLADGRELAAVKPGDAYKVLTYDGSYVDAECSAFDDMFPTIDPYTPQDGLYRGVTYPDHGESCRIPFEVSIEGDSVLFTAHSHRFAVAYEKRVSFTEDGALSLAYRFVNEADEAFPFVFAAHIMLQGEDGMRLITPFAADAPKEMMFAPAGVTLADVPHDRLMGFLPGEGAAYKFYYLEPMAEGAFSLQYADGSSLSFAFDREKLPYLGVWLNNGEFQGIYNVAPEPCSAPFDAPDKAAKRGYGTVIPPRGEYAVTMIITRKMR